MALEYRPRLYRLILITAATMCLSMTGLARAESHDRTLTSDDHAYLLAQATAYADAKIVYLAGQKHDVEIAIESANAPAAPEAPLGLLSASSVLGFNTARPADRVTLWRGHLRQ